MLQDEAELRRGEAPVDRHRDRAQVVRREDRRHELVAVVREQADHVTRADTTLLEPARQCGSPVDHPLVGDGLVAEHAERLVGSAARVVLQHAEPTHVGIHGAEYPPSTTSADPVVQRDASLARYP